MDVRALFSVKVCFQRRLICRQHDPLKMRQVRQVREERTKFSPLLAVSDLHKEFSGDLACKTVEKMGDQRVERGLSAAFSS